MGFWIQLGVVGFRMDAVPFVISTKGPRVKKPLLQYDMLRGLREFLQWRKGDAIILAEANVLPETNMQYFGQDGDRMHMMFNFQVNQNLFYALAAADSRPLVQALKATKPRPATAQWGLFLRNHDELDLGRLTEEQRQRVFECFEPEKEMQLYHRGIRRRLVPMLNGDRRRIELAYSLMFTLPGTPVVRYGARLGWEMISICPSAIALARRCNGRRSLMRDSRNRTSQFCRLSAMDPTATSMSMPRSRGAIRIRCSTGQNASSACARKFRKSAGATLKCFRLEIQRCSQSAMIGATIPSCLSTIWMPFPER
jgi:hypothetical protein